MPRGDLGVQGRSGPGSPERVLGHAVPTQGRSDGDAPSFFWLPVVTRWAIEPHLSKSQSGARHVNDTGVISGLIEVPKGSGRWLDRRHRCSSGTAVQERQKHWSHRPACLGGIAKKLSPVFEVLVRRPRLIGTRNGRCDLRRVDLLRAQGRKMRRVIAECSQDSASIWAPLH